MNRVKRNCMPSKNAACLYNLHALEETARTVRKIVSKTLKNHRYSVW